MSDVRYAVAPILSVDVRDNANGGTAWSMSGYAAVFNQQTTLYDGKFVKVNEDIDPEAFARVFREQKMTEPSGVVHFNLGHDMNRVVAATNVANGEPGSLRLRTDNHGLQFFAKVSRDDPDGIALASKMRTGVIGQASFAFTIGSLESRTVENDNGPDVIHDRIMEIAHLYDVCACGQGAYSQTVSGLRTYAVAIGQLSTTWDERDHPRQATLEAGLPVSPEDPGDGMDITSPRRIEWPADLDERLAQARSLRPIVVDTSGGRDVHRGHQGRPVR